MNKLIAICLLVTVSIPALALVNGNDVLYVGGTPAGLKAGQVGQLDLSSSTDLVYTAGATRIGIPYASITSFSYSQENEHRLGVLPAIAAGLVAARMKRHLFYVSYKDANGGAQTLTLELSREAVGPTKMAIEMRIPEGACKSDCRKPQKTAAKVL